MNQGKRKVRLAGCGTGASGESGVRVRIPRFACTRVSKRPWWERVQQKGFTPALPLWRGM